MIVQSLNSFHCWNETCTTRSNLGIPEESHEIVQLCRQSVASIPALKKVCKKAVISQIEDNLNDHLSLLGKFSNIVTLEKKEHAWNKIMRSGLPQGQLSFLLRAGSDTFQLL